jgi:O-6-methylguanine DNA methyltransferase
MTANISAANAAVTAALTALRTRAPSTITDRVLADAGLADRYDVVDGPTGPLWVSFAERGITGVAPARPGEDPAQLLAGRHGRRAVPGRLPARLRSSVERVLRTGRLGGLRVDLSHLTDFQRAVLAKTAQIPPGQIRPYGWVAREIGQPGAVRAVGSALNRNPVPVLVPCHRVGRSDGAIGEYAFGRPMKRALLAAEGVDTDQVEAMAERRVRFVGSDTTDIYCLPTCLHGRRVTERHRVEFHSKEQAEAEGYRACKVCRPAAAA